MVIRKAEVRDISGMTNVFASAVENTSEFYTVNQRAVWVSQSLRPAFWEELIRTHHILVCFEMNALVGLIAFSSRGEVSMLYILPQFQRRGIASRLIAIISEYAHEEGYAHVKVDASLYLRPLLLKLGFELVEEYTKTIKDVEFPNAILVKELI
jgi:putative acetyltransferase